MEPEKQEIRNVSYYLAKFYEKQGVLNQIEGRFIFRGIPNANWSVASSAGRRLRREGSNKQADFIRYHINLIETARKFGYGGLESGSQLSDLEILAEIQHYGGATCLTDFSTNFLVALWFATEPIPHKENYKNDRTEINIETVSQDTDGKVIWLDLDNRNNFARISYYNQESDECSIYKILTNTESNFEAKQHKVEPCFWLWEPTKLNNRIIKQDSVFLFGLPAFPKDKADEKLIEKEDESGLDAKLQLKKIKILRM